MPPYVALCVETVRRHHPDARLLDRESFDEVWTTDRDVPLDQLGPQHRSDFVRAWLLHHHGGIWVDPDFVLLRPFDELFALRDPLTFSGYREAERQFANNLMFSREGDPVLAACYARVATHLRAGEPIEWLEIGAYPLTAAVEAHPESVSVIDAELVYPIPWYEAKRYEVPGTAEKLVEPPRYGAMLSNNSLSEDMRARSRDEVLKGDTLLGDLLRRALA